MATAIEEGALDLSKAKMEFAAPSPESPRGKDTGLSPVPSLGSDGDGNYNTSDTTGGRGRANSECSDSRDGHSPLGGTVRPVAGPIPTSYAPTRQTQPTGGQLAGEGGMPSSLRPFKMYPFEPLPNPSLYGQMVSPPISMAQSMFPGFGSSGGMSPLSPSPVSVLDNAISLSSPITQYLQQRKRRIESRMSRDTPGPKEKEARTESTDGEHSLDEGSPNYDEGLPIDIRDVSIDRKVSLVPEEKKDDAYWERRRKNNDAAKRSRDARRAKEEEIALRAAFLEQENLKLRAQVAILKNETAKLHYMLYNRI